MFSSCLTIVLLVAVSSSDAFWRGPKKEDEKLVARCVIDNPNLWGVITLEQHEHKESPLEIKGEIHGLTPGKHGMHVHRFGDLSKDCKTTGPHFNPYDAKHGGKNDDEGHKGDLGNIVADDKKIARFEIEDKFMTLFGKYSSIIGRSIVVHAKEDDLGKGKNEESHISGNSGEGVGCCVIGLAHFDDKLLHF